MTILNEINAIFGISYSDIDEDKTAEGHNNG